MNDQVRLTQFSAGAGCGCKISPVNLANILKTNLVFPRDKNLLVGYDSKDDAAVYDLGNGNALISTTDFFTPVVDDPFDYGRIAATNAISDVYAMGGKPFLALALLGWPLSKLNDEIAARVIDGARTVCNDLNVSLAGGHSIDISDPIFGLAVNGIISKENIRQNNTVEAGCRIFLTKPLGIGILTTAIKRLVITEEDLDYVTRLMCSPNSIGTVISGLSCVRAMTDVTGFGLSGHLLEMCEGSETSAVINFSKIPVINNISKYIDLDCIPGGTHRNWKSYGSSISLLEENEKNILCDPQTSGGLLIAVRPEGISDFLDTMKANHSSAWEIGFFEKQGEGEKVRVS